MTPAALALPLSAVVTLLLLRRETWPRLAIEPFPNPLRRRTAVALLVLVLALASFAPLIAFDVAPPSEEGLGDIGFASLFLGHALLASFLLLWWVLAGRPRPRDFLHLRLDPAHLASDLQLGAAGGAAAWAVTMTVMALVGTAVGAIESEAVETATRGEIPEVVRWIVDRSASERMLLILSAAVVEEAFFRSFLQARCGILISSLFFMASHGSYGLPLMLVGVFTVSLVLGWIFRARDNVLPCMVAHGVFDAIQLFLILPAVVSASS
jgi:membrane protease YdiL (CAAX protease family)